MNRTRTIKACKRLWIFITATKINTATKTGIDVAKKTLEIDEQKNYKILRKTKSKNSYQILQKYDVPKERYSPPVKRH